MKYLITALILFSVLFLNAQNSEIREIQSFDKIEVFGNIEVIMTLSDKEELRIETKNVNTSEVNTKIKDKLLKIKMSSNLFDDNAKVKIFVSYKEIREVTSNASAEIKFMNNIKGDKLFVNATSGGRIILTVELNAIEISAYQGAHINISGKTKTQESFVNSGGILSASNFESDEVFIKMNTGGKAELIVKNSIDANVNTGASLNYFGKPVTEKINTSLGGKVNAWDKN